MFSRSSVAARRIPAVAAGRRQAARQVVGRRFASTDAPSGGSGGYVAAGVAGGAVVLLGVYGYYHYSGAKAAVDSLASVRNTMVQAKDKVLEKTPSTSEALQYLRSTASSYAIFVPGGKVYVDSTFDALEDARQTHGEEVDKIVKSAYEEIKTAVNKGGADFDTAQKVGDILSKRGKELAKVAQKASGDLLDKYPGAKEKLGGAYGDLQKLASGSGEQGKKMWADVQKQLNEIMQSGSPDEAMKKASELLQGKTKEVQGMGDQAWQKALDAAKPYLDKVPDIRKTLDENKGALMSAVAGAGAGGGSDLWDRVKKLADTSSKERQKATDEFKNYVKDLASKAESKGEDAWDSLEDLIKSFPGGSQILESSPDVKKYADAFRDKAPEAKKLAEEAAQDIMKVLKEKATKIGELGQKATEEGKKR